ncbi:MAG: GrpB family protein [Chloroflexi bacterium]|nr:GrpB family protein [Chloroflexota bacterium]
MATPPTPEEQARVRAHGVVLRPYDPLWPARFEAAKAAILAATGELLVALEHVGSTAIPGIGAKPYLDLMPALKTLEDADRLAAALATLGYKDNGEAGIPGRRYLTRYIEGDPHVWKHNVHAYEQGHDEYIRHLVFRDALRASPALREQYWALKQRLAALHRDDVDAYAMAKSDFVDNVIAAAGGPARDRAAEAARLAAEAGPR